LGFFQVLSLKRLHIKKSQVPDGTGIWFGKQKTARIISRDSLKYENREIILSTVYLFGVFYLPHFVKEVGQFLKP
jgi:hypothetical protein